MPKKYIAMTAWHRPSEDPEVIFSFPVGKYKTDKLCSLFLENAKQRILSFTMEGQPRQATDVQLDAYGETEGLIMRCVARFGGMERLDFELFETRKSGISGEMPVRLGKYRGPKTLGPSGWDVIHSDEGNYPSEPGRYAAQLDKFFRGEADGKTDRL